MFSFTFDNVLAPGRYCPMFQLAHRGSGLDVIDRFEGSFSFVVTGPGALGGLVDLPVQSEVSRTGSGGRQQDASVSVAGTLRTRRSGGRSAGPRALSGDWRRFWHLTFNIAVMQWKLRFFGSALGYVWQLVRPLLLFLVLYVFFTKIAHIGSGDGRRATTTTAPSCSARSCCSRSSARRRWARCEASSTTSRSCARSSFRGW